MNKEGDEIDKDGPWGRSALGRGSETAGIAREDIRTDASCDATLPAKRWA
jgi:hypothetical protein